MIGTTDTLIIAGAGGDLAQRLLLPGLGRLLATEDAPTFRLIGVDAETISDDAWQSLLETAFGPDLGDAARRVIEGSTHLEVDITRPDDLRRLFDAADGVPAMYFAVPPGVTVRACAAMEDVDLPAGLVLCLEKPFGTDLDSAVALNRQLQRLVPENQVFRIDHFLGKSTVLNLLGLRFGNRVIENMWSSDNVSRVDIVFDESLTLENRAGYYDRAGALVDMIQSHLLIVAALVAMEAPSSIDADDLRGALAQALRAIRLDGDAAGATRRARYTAGRIGDREVPNYTDEPGVDLANNTETLAEVRLAVDTWRWAGVPFTLRSGKSLGERRKEIVLELREVPHLPTGLTGRVGPTRLRIALDPDGIQLGLLVNGEGNPFELEKVEMDVNLAPGSLPAYGEVLRAILDRDPTLSIRDDVTEECWRIVGNVLDAWKAGEVAIDEYPAGSSGPANWARI